MKAAILAGGLGKRLRPLTEVIPKPLIFVGGAAMIDHCISALEGVGISEIVIVVSPYTEAPVRRHIAERYNKVSFVRQDVPLGTGDAVSKLYPSTGDVLVISSDVTVNESSLSNLIGYHERVKPIATILGVKVRNPSRYGALMLEGDHLKGVVEKPALPVSNVINSGIYVLSEEALKATLNLPFSPRGEKEITDAFNYLSSSGKDVRVITDEGSWWHDVGDFASMIKANEYYLQRGNAEPYVSAQHEVKTKDGGKIIGPSFVSNEATIRGTVGPFVSIDRGCIVEEGSSVERSIMMKGSKIRRAFHVSYSIVAPGAVVNHDGIGTPQSPFLFFGGEA
ncbi:MAG: sugar phosphate nucleotidyltransferase [Thermoprotei archaeon]